MYITEQHLSRIVDSINAHGRYITEQRLFSYVNADSTVFLSHKHDERQLLFKVKALLEDLNMKVYVDWMESNMQHPTDANTANELKYQIQKQNKFILIASEAAISSPWCNWELGMGDILKSSSSNIAILPIADTTGKWPHNEYLRIYPYIEYLDGSTRNSSGHFIPKGYYVFYTKEDGGRTYYNLETWLKRGMPQRMY